MDRDGAIAPSATTPDAAHLPPSVAHAATVVLLRDGERGPEVLLARRPDRARSFPGAWVFPGGMVEPGDVIDGDAAGEPAARRAAVREAEEEIGLVVDPGELVPFSQWTPPAGSPKMLITTFFAARVPDGALRPEPAEVADLAWMRPAEALDRHASGGMILWPPTWVTLHQLSGPRSVDEALAGFRAGEVRSYLSRRLADRTTLVWQEDSEYPGAADVPGPAAAVRHRLLMERLPWVYLSDL